MGFLGSLFAAKNNFQAKNLVGSPNYTAQPNLPYGLAQAQEMEQQNLGLAGKSREQQEQLNQQLMAQATGQAPSLAQAQLQQVLTQQNAQSAATLGSQRGINPALAARMIAQQQAANNQGMAGQAATAGIQERLASQSTLAQALAGQRQQDIGTAGLGLSREQLLQQALASQNQQAVQQNFGVQGINARVAQQNTEAANKFGAGILGGASAALGLGGFSKGGKVAGQAEAEGDDEENDTVPAMLSPGEIVVPRSMAKDADTAKAFVEAIINHHKRTARSKKNPFSDGGKVGYAEGGEVEADPIIGEIESRQAEPRPILPIIKNFLTKPIGGGAGLPAGVPPYDASKFASVDEYEGYMKAKLEQDPQAFADVPAGSKASQAVKVPPEQQVRAPGQQPESAGPPKPGVEQQLQDIEGFGRSAIEKQLSAAEQQSKAGMQAYGNLDRNLQKLQQDTKTHLDTLHSQNAQMFSDMVQEKVNPSRFFDNQNTFQKVLSAISVALGGIAGQGQGNVGLDIINKAVERDIEAQKADSTNKRNLFNLNLARTKNFQEAQLLTQNQMLTAASAQIAKASAQFQGAQARANADAMQAQLGEQIMNRNAMLAQMKAKSDLMGGAADINPELLPKEDRERLVTLPNGKFRLANSVEDAKHVKEMTEKFAPLEHILDELDKLGPSALVPGKARERAGSLVSSSIPMLGQIYKLGVLSESDREMLKEALYNPKSFSQQFFGGRERSNALREVVARAIEGTLKGRLSGGIKSRPSFGVPYEAK